jgi:biopolymer transport protein ExbB/TolQ
LEDYANFVGRNAHRLRPPRYSTDTIPRQGSHIVPNSTNFPQAAARSPVLWGSTAAIGFYGLIHSGVIDHAFVTRYCASHPVEYVTTTMFLIGLAAVAIRGIAALVQGSRLAQPLLGPIPAGGQPVGDCDALLARMDQLPESREQDYLVARVRESLEYVRRWDTPENLDEQLRYLSDRDATQLHARSALVRVIIWAIPMLGFLGTVMGLTMAIAHLDIKVLEESTLEVVGGLAVAFDTTALGIALSLLLMFAQFLTDRQETSLLAEVDQRASDELEGRFRHVASTPDGQLTAVRRMAETVVEVAEELVHRQADVWQKSLDVAAGRWTEMTRTAGEHLQQTLGSALSDSLRTHAEHLAAAEQAAAERAQGRWEALAGSQSQQIEALGAIQSAMVKQGDVLGRAVEASGEVTRLQDALNRNLASLAGAKNFEQTVMSLAAAIHLLNARLTQTPDRQPGVQLDRPTPASKAA